MCLVVVLNLVLYNTKEEEEEEEEAWVGGHILFSRIYKRNDEREKRKRREIHDKNQWTIISHLFFSSEKKR